MTPSSLIGPQANFVASAVGFATARGVTDPTALARVATDAIDAYQSTLSTLSSYPLGSVFGDESPAR